MNETLSGLSSREVEERRERGEGGSKARQITKTRGQIVRENVCTLFNFLNFLIAALLFAVGAYSNMLFLAIIILNIVIGIAQEWKAKKLVDELSILNRPKIRVRRDNQELSVELEDVVKDDLMVLESGNQICNDAVVVEGTLEVNESLLTGESDAVVKEQGEAFCPEALSSPERHTQGFSMWAMTIMPPSSPTRLSRRSGYSRSFWVPCARLPILPAS